MMNRYLFGGWVYSLFLCVSFMACEGGTRIAPALLEDPADLESMDLSVREQLMELKSRVQLCLEEGCADEDLGSTVGTLGAWFQAYQLRDRAALLYREAARLDPGEPKWYYYIGIIAASQERSEEAITAFTKASESMADHLPLMVRMGKELAKSGM